MADTRPVTIDSLDVGLLRRWLTAFADDVADHREQLTQLDAAIGDADHGSNLDRGMTAVVAALDKTPPATPAALFKATGMTLVSTVGGASGPLYGTLFLRMAASAGDAETLDAAAFGAALRAGLGGVVARGKAEAGDKTMFDALAPACDAYDAAVADGAGLAAALAAAAQAADAGPGRHDPAAGPQGPGLLPGRTQRRPPGPRRDVDRAADRGGRAGRRLSRR